MRLLKNKLVIYNTQTKEKELFTPQKNDTVSLYVCGVTPYDYAHIGHARCYVHFDTVVRLLKSIGYTVSYVRNITDVDDKLIAKAFNQGAVAQDVCDKVIELGAFFANSFNEDMSALNCLSPHHEPKVSSHVPQIISFISQLIEKKYAYVVGGDIYFDTSTDSKYGNLSRRDIDQLQAGARVAVAEQKRHPADFVLWKSDDRGTFWESPWGNGRPGWHIECSSFINEYAGLTVDIHGGGIDLLFPHHENERAQSECAHDGAVLAKYWMHNAHVKLDSQKMSKSLGNVRTVKDVLQEFAAPVLRLFFLQHHYRTPIDFTTQYLSATEKAYKKLLVLGLVEKATKLDSSLIDVSAIMNALYDDLNAPKAIGLIFGVLKKAKQDLALARNLRLITEDILGITLVGKESAEEYSLQIQQLITQRDEARKNKDWKAADEIRDELAALGVNLKDSKL